MNFMQATEKELDSCTGETVSCISCSKVVYAAFLSPEGGWWEKTPEVIRLSSGEDPMPSRLRVGGQPGTAVTTPAPRTVAFLLQEHINSVSGVLLPR